MKNVKRSRGIALSFSDLDRYPQISGDSKAIARWRKIPSAQKRRSLLVKWLKAALQNPDAELIQEFDVARMTGLIVRIKSKVLS